jgi:2-haloacid dehalogenase
LHSIRALLFDVFGTVVDWRSSIIAEGDEFNRRKGLEVDWAQFADRWRAMYQPAMEQVRSGAREWTILDTLHRESLDALLPEFGLAQLNEEERQYLNRVWHRLRPWPDAVEGLTRMKAERIIATCSNGNVALIVNMAKHSALPWDMVLGAEVTHHYKPLPESYLASARLLGLEPGQCCMVAAHNSDLVAAGALGFATAFVPRPTEYGPGQDFDLMAENPYTFVAQDFLDLARQLTNHET